MVACLDRPCSNLVQHFASKGRIKGVGHSEFTVGEFERENQVKLKELEQKREQLTYAAYGAGFSVIAGFAMFSPAAMGSIPALGAVLGSLQRVSQRYFVMSELLKEFEDENVAIEVGLKPDGLREIDFFLKFPDKEYVLLKLRSLGAAAVLYDEEQEALRFRDIKRGGSKVWKPDPLAELAEQELWVRRYRSDLLGTSSRDKRRPLAKVLVLMSDTVLGDNPEHLWDRIDQQNYLIIRRRGTFNIVEKDRVTNFIRSYLVSRRDPKTS